MGLALSAGVHAGCVVLLGIRVAGAIVCFTCTANWNLREHVSIRAGRLDPGVGRLVITPVAHRVHHGAGPADRDRTFGAILPIRDRALDTRSHDSRPAEALVFGLGPDGRQGSGDLAALRLGPLWPAKDDRALQPARETTPRSTEPSASTERKDMVRLAHALPTVGLAVNSGPAQAWQSSPRTRARARPERTATMQEAAHPLRAVSGQWTGARRMPHHVAGLPVDVVLA